MSVPTRRAVRLEEPVPSECTLTPGSAARCERIERIGRVRVPLTLTHRPWATLYRDTRGAETWLVRLPDGGRPRVVAVSTERLLAYAAVCGLRRLEADVELLRRAAAARDADR